MLFVSYVKWKEWTLEEKVEQRIGQDSHRQVLWVFSQEEVLNLHWEHEREFEYRGEMYDVIERESNGDSVFLLCFHDREETELKRKMVQFLVRQPDNSYPLQETEIRFFDFFSKLIIGASNQYQKYVPALWHSNAGGKIPFFYRWENEAPPSPPPKALA